MKDANTHDEILEQLVARLIKKPRYVLINKKVPYFINNHGGELDVFAAALENNKLFYHYYEVKSSYNRKSWEHAIQQFEKLYTVFPSEKWKFIYVSPQRIRQYRPKQYPCRNDECGINFYFMKTDDEHKTSKK